MNRYANLVGANKIKDEYTKINDGFDAVEAEMDIALNQSSQALDLATAAEQTASEANDTADQALMRADSVQTQLDTIVIDGDSSVEAAQARVNADGSVTYDTLKERLDAEYTEVTNKIKDMFVNVKDYGAKGDGVTDDTAAIQAAIDAAELINGVVLIPSLNFKLTNRVLVDSPVTIMFASGSKMIQTIYAYPIFETRGSGINFVGKFKAENTEAAYEITPSEITSRGLTVPAEVTNDPKGYSAAIACIGNVNSIYVEHVESIGFVSTVSFLSAVSSDANYSKDVKVDYAYGENQWCTILGGGFLSARFEEVVGREMAWSQGVSPNHVVYIGTRPLAPDHNVYIGRVIGYDSPDMSYIVQVKTVNKFVCGEVVGYNCSQALNIGEGCPDAKVGSVKGYFVDNTVSKDNIIKTSDGSKCVIHIVDITASSTHDAVSLAAVIGAPGTGTELEVFTVKAKLTAASNPIRLVRSTSTIKLHNVSVEYTVVPTVHPLLCEGGSLYIYQPPVVKGAGNLLVQVITPTDYFLAFDPNLISGDCDDTTISIDNNDFSKLYFHNLDKTPVEQTATIAQYNLRARNVLKLKKGGATITHLLRGSHMQEYVLICGDDGTAPSIAHGTGNIFLKSGTDYAVDTWKALRFICMNDNFYEV